MDEYFYKETAGTRLKGAEKAAIFLGEMDPGTASIISGFLSTNELKKIRKSMKKIGTSINVYHEIAVLSEALKRGMVKGIVPAENLQTNPQKYARKSYDVNQNPETIADVIATWMQDEK
ncbi:MAG: hypothetical protein IKK38_06290 [Spirochaetaceae bacterium]|nr:hypothetical protein [Spirochaetaceae bacterium]MBR3813468.1 hypothetical protein [Spirochaetaceae bacterium]MDD6485854.1 hypothetical protein [Spirochaetales bacterium]